MNSLQNISVVATNCIPALVFIGMSDMLREMLAPEIEKKLKRKMNDWDWQYYIRENFRRAEVDSRQEPIRRRQKRLGDMQIIHDFVWREDRGNPR
ncbi:hypothetical protein ACFLXD_04585 [Chloroflexota bacterium]